MKNQFKNQRGSIDLILIGVFLVLAAGLGGYVYYQQEQAQKTYDAAGSGATVSKRIVTKKTDTPGSTPEAVVAEKTTTTQYVIGATFELDKSVGNLLQWNGTSQLVNLSSDKLLAKEKELYGDAILHCEANGYPLGRINVKDSSTPLPGFVLVKKLDSGKYLFYQNDGTTSFCYKERPKLQTMISQQINLLSSAIKNAH